MIADVSGREVAVSFWEVYEAQREAKPRNAEGKAMVVGVKEKPDTIHLANPLHAA
jgi:hypothetical protein